MVVLIKGVDVVPLERLKAPGARENGRQENLCPDGDSPTASAIPPSGAGRGRWWNANGVMGGMKTT